VKRYANDKRVESLYNPAERTQNDFLTPRQSQKPELGLLIYSKQKLYEERLTKK